MTLIVARSEDGETFITSDTLLSKINGEKLSYDECVVKIAIINFECCICFAGNFEPANIAITHLIKAEYQTVNEILQYLYSVHQEYNQSVDFGVITNIGGKTSLYSLKDGVPESNVINLWLGDHFNTFQHKMSEFQNEATLKEKMSSAINALIQDGNIVSVGGFQISVSTDNDNFQYEDNNGKRPITGFSYSFGIQHSIGPQVLEFEAAGDLQSISGISNDNVSVFSSISPYFPGVAIHYMHANRGYFFCPHLRVKRNETDKTLQAFVFENVTPQVFITKILEEYNVKVKGFVADDSGRITYVAT
ncbi:MAG: hypothetical protein ACJAS1_006562 [Oleiphilaceae bacterium]|jgi:hypothetical protein